MSGSQYLVRFDDLCPTANWDAWDPVESALMDADVRPLVAVVPDNRDPKLVAAEADPKFWDRVRRWQTAGWHIAMHGHQHVYSSAARGLVGLHAKSEFAGVDRAEQARKLDAGLAVFERENVRVDGWIAPGHTFDLATVQLLAERGVRTISDGFGFRPFTGPADTYWIPCQTWTFQPHRFGLWTVCYHVNSWAPKDVDAFRRDLATYRDRILDVDGARAAYGTRPEPLTEKAMRTYRRARVRIGR